ncbi:MAG: hypothetical protein ABEJ04_05255 [Halobacteriaceae archaeon]
MNLERVPLVGPLLAFEERSPGYSVLLLLGPVVVAAVALAGRTAFTVVLAAAYVLAFVCYALYQGLTGASRHG